MIVFVVLVAFKQSLDGVSSQQKLVIFNKVSILPVVIVHVIEIEIVSSLAGNEW